MTPSILVTGGRGFIGSNFVRLWLETQPHNIVNLDALTYAAHSDSDIANHPRYRFHHGSIGDRTLVGRLLTDYQPVAVVNFAAESHVDRSIAAAADFITTNINGTFTLLEACRDYWQKLAAPQAEAFRFLHISTDEVFGSLQPQDPAFDEDTPYRPNSPYSASKAASDHLVRAWHHTYGLPVLITNCSNNYGPFQFPEKLIPLTIRRALQGETIPVYGDGQNIRDWLYVADHCRAVLTVLEKGSPGDCYAVGGDNQIRNLDLVRQVCALLDQRRPRRDGNRYSEQIGFVTDRAGHDFRYAINATKIQRELGWQAQERFDSGLAKTIDWYLKLW